jgi:hypothetical protein
VLRRRRVDVKTLFGVRHAARHPISIKSEQAEGAERDVAEHEEHPRILCKHVQRHFDVPISMRGIYRSDAEYALCTPANILVYALGVNGSIGSPDHSSHCGRVKRQEQTMVEGHGARQRMSYQQDKV